MQRYSTVRGRRLSGYERIVERFASSRAGARLFLNVCNPIDRRLLALTRGRLSLAIGAPVGMLDTTGARSGQPRRTPLLYLVDGDRVVLVASNGGSPRHPAWYHTSARIQTCASSPATADGIPTGRASRRERSAPDCGRS